MTILLIAMLFPGCVATILLVWGLAFIFSMALSVLFFLCSLSKKLFLLAFPKMAHNKIV